MLLFRDFLRKNNDYLKKYIQIKKDLSEKYPQDRLSYQKEKEPFIKEVLNIAKMKYQT